MNKNIITAVVALCISVIILGATAIVNASRIADLKQELLETQQHIWTAEEWCIALQNENDSICRHIGYSIYDTDLNPEGNPDSIQ